MLATVVHEKWNLEAIPWIMRALSCKNKISDKIYILANCSPYFTALQYFNNPETKRSYKRTVNLKNRYEWLYRANLRTGNCLSWAKLFSARLCSFHFCLSLAKLFFQFISNHFEFENVVNMTPKRRSFLPALFFTWNNNSLCVNIYIRQ